MREGSRRTQDLAQKLLNSFTIQSRVKRRRESSSIFKEEFPRRLRAIHLAVRFAPSDHSKPLALWPTTRSTISFNESHPMRIERSSCVRVSHTITGHDPHLPHFRPSDEDRTIAMRPHIAHDRQDCDNISIVRFSLKAIDGLSLRMCC